MKIGVIADNLQVLMLQKAVSEIPTMPVLLLQ